VGDGRGAGLISADVRWLWKRLAEVHGLTDGAGPDASLAEKIERRAAAIRAFLSGLKDWEAVERAMAAMNIAWGRVRPGRALAEQPTVRHRGTVAQVDDRAGGTRPIPQSPYRFSAARSEVRGGAAHKGEHNGAVLADWLGRPAADAAALEAAGVMLAAERAGV
jgi:crotonobetainyl-CoA:carnitine CoA-transferase CaiB-like acyl-CoA transferase